MYRNLRKMLRDDKLHVYRLISICQRPPIISQTQSSFKSTTDATSRNNKNNFKTLFTFHERNEKQAICSGSVREWSVLATHVRRCHDTAHDARCCWCVWHIQVSYYYHVHSCDKQNTNNGSLCAPSTASLQL